MTATPATEPAAPAEGARCASLAALAEPDPSAPLLTDADRLAARRVALGLPRVPVARMAEVDKILYGEGLETR